MDFSFLTAFSSVLISAVISFLFYRKNKSVDFDFDYRKYLVEKRKSAYEALEPLLSDLGTMVTFRETNQQVFSFLIRKDCNPAIEFNKKTAALTQYRFWYSNEMAETVDNINKIAFEIQNTIPPKPTTEEMANITALMREDLLKAWQDLTRIYYSDLIELANINKFKKQKSLIRFSDQTW